MAVNSRTRAPLSKLPEGTTVLGLKPCQKQRRSHATFWRATGFHKCDQRCMEQSFPGMVIRRATQSRREDALPSVIEGFLRC